MKYFFTLLLFVVILSPSRAQKFTPALLLVKGGIYYLSNTGTSAIVQSMSGKENKVDLTASFKMAFKVADISDSAYNMEVSYQSIAMKIQMADTTIDMDSKKSSALDLPSSIMAAMMNHPFNITLSKSGKVTSVENIQKMINTVFDGFPKIDTAKKQQFKKQFTESFGAGSFKDVLEMGTAIFPTAAVGKNDTWTINTVAASPAKANVATTYQLVDVTGDFYQIHGDGTLVSDKDVKAAAINGLSMKYNLNGTSLIDIKVSKDTGWISEVNLRQLMSGNIEIADNPKAPGGMTIPMTFNIVVNTTDVP
ncbi:MAG: DUF6263 family protein [Sphingobacteriales bacterium]